MSVAKDELIERIYWFIKLRWIAVIGVIVVAFSIRQFFNIPLPIYPIFGIASLLGLYNLAFLIYLNKIQKKSAKNQPLIINNIANMQISLDLLGLTALIHFS